MFNKLKNAVKRGGAAPSDTDPVNLVFVHIPKCGGTSLVIALRNAFGGAGFQSFDYIPTYHAARAMQPVWEPSEWLETWFRTRAMFLHRYLLQKHDFIYGHMPLSELAVREAQKRGYRLFTVLRDPVERFISNYIYDKTGPGIRIPDSLPQMESTPKDELDCFLATPEARWMANEQLLMIAGLPVDGVDLSDASIIERAAKNAETLSLIGWVDQLDCFAEDFNQLFGRELHIEHHNDTRAWIMRGDKNLGLYNKLFTDAARCRIRELAFSEYAWLEALKDKRSNDIAVR
jgi:hypothetical protein